MGVAETCFVPRGTRIDSWIVFGNFQGYHFLGAKKICLLSKSTVGHLAILSNRSFLPGEMPPLGVFHLGFKKSGYELITNVALYRGISPKLYCLVHPNLHLFINHIC